MTEKMIHVEAYAQNLVDAVQAFVKSRQEMNHAPDSAIIYLIGCIVRTALREVNVEPTEEVGA